jgi:hypothetical protein
MLCSIKCISELNIYRVKLFKKWYKFILEFIEIFLGKRKLQTSDKIANNMVFMRKIEKFAKSTYMVSLLCAWAQVGSILIDNTTLP